jgi:hypothetical protein
MLEGEKGGRDTSENSGKHLQLADTHEKKKKRKKKKS